MKNLKVKSKRRCQKSSSRGKRVELTTLKKRVRTGRRAARLNLRTSSSWLGVMHNRNHKSLWLNPGWNQAFPISANTEGAIELHYTEEATQVGSPIMVYTIHGSFKSQVAMFLIKFLQNFSLVGTDILYLCILFRSGKIKKFGRTSYPMFKRSNQNSRQQPYPGISRKTNQLSDKELEQLLMGQKITRDRYILVKFQNPNLVRTDVMREYIIRYLRIPNEHLARVIYSGKKEIFITLVRAEAIWESPTFLEDRLGTRPSLFVPEDLIRDPLFFMEVAKKLLEGQETCQEARNGLRRMLLSLRSKDISKLREITDICTEEVNKPAPGDNTREIL
jgi:hypothetical protein